MWQFRKRPQSLSKEEQKQLQELFAAVPALAVVYQQRERLAEIFDTAPDRATAAQQLQDWYTQAGDDWSGFWRLYERHRDAILAYFDERKTSGVVEGINNKARTIIKRCYGIKTAGTLRNRLILDINRACDRLGRSIAAIRQIVKGLQTHFCGLYT